MFSYAEHADELEYLAVAASRQLNDKFVVEVKPNYCFPGGGGYPSDCGTLNGVAFESFDNGCPVVAYEVTGPVTVIINKKRRFTSSQLHSGQHLLSAVFLADYGANSSSFTIFDDYATIELDKKLSSEQIQTAELRINELIQYHIPINSTIYYNADGLPDRLRSKEIYQFPYRVVSIEGVDVCGCCGTHLDNTGRLMVCKVLTAQSGRQGSKLAFSFGMPAFYKLAARYTIVDELTQQLTTADTQLVHSVGALQGELKAQNKKVYLLFRQLVPSLVAEDQRVVGTCHVSIVATMELSREEMQAVLSFTQKYHENAAVIQRSKGRTSVVVVSAYGRAYEVLDLLKSQKNANGGGTAKRAAGDFEGTVDDALRLLESVFHYV